MSQVLTKPIMLDETGQSLNVTGQAINTTGQAINQSISTTNANLAQIVEHIDGTNSNFAIAYEDKESNFEKSVKNSLSSLSDTMFEIKDIMEVTSRYCTGIAVTTPPDKISYGIGDTFDATGMRIAASMTNGADIVLYDITNLCTITVDSPLKLSTTAATITYKDKDNNTFTTTVALEVTVPSWSDGSDESIIAALNAHYNNDIDLTQYWSVGEERLVKINSVELQKNLDQSYSRTDTDPQYMTMVLAHAGGKELATPINNHTDCAFIVFQKTILTNANTNELGYTWPTLTQYYINQGHQTSPIGSGGEFANPIAGGWDECELRTWANGNFYNAIDSSIKGIFKQVKNISTDGSAGDGYTVSVDYFAPPAEKEITGTNTEPSAIAEGSLVQFDYFKTSINRCCNYCIDIIGYEDKKEQWASYATYEQGYWTRSTPSDGDIAWGQCALKNGSWGMGSWIKYPYDQDTGTGHSNFCALFGCI